MLVYSDKIVSTTCKGSDKCNWELLTGRLERGLIEARWGDVETAKRVAQLKAYLTLWILARFKKHTWEQKLTFSYLSVSLIVYFMFLVVLSISGNTEVE